MKIIFAIFGLLAGTALVPNALADDTAPLSELVTCMKFDGLTKVMDKLGTIGADRRDVVDSRFDARFEVNDGGVLPTRFFVREAGHDVDMTINEDGGIPDFEKIQQAGETAELCTEDPSRAGLPRESGAMAFLMNFGVYFNDTPGIHSLEQLKEGAKDGRTFYKKLAPGPASMLVPKFKYVTLTYEDESLDPDVKATQNGEPVKGLVIEPFYESYVISLEQLDLIGADSLVITGGPYRLSPSPSPKKMESFRKKD